MALWICHYHQIMNRRSTAIFWWNNIVYQRSVRLQRSILGHWRKEKRNWLAYCKQHNIPYALKPSLTKFKFCDVVFSSLGTIQIIIPTLNYPFLKIKVNAVTANVPLLCGLDASGNEKIVENNIQNEPRAKRHFERAPSDYFSLITNEIIFQSCMQIFHS